MTDLATLEAMRDELLKARGKPQSSVRSASGHMVTYRTDAELAAALADIERRIAAAQGKRPRVVYFQATKGI